MFPPILHDVERVVAESQKGGTSSMLVASCMRSDSVWNETVLQTEAVVVWNDKRSHCGLRGVSMSGMPVGCTPRKSSSISSLDICMPFTSRPSTAR